MFESENGPFSESKKMCKEPTVEELYELAKTKHSSCLDVLKKANELMKELKKRHYDYRKHIREIVGLLYLESMDLEDEINSIETRM